jgi:tetratricopeptide (TPR) repeat protein
MSGTSRSASERRRSRLQFTVRGLLLAVTACAVLLSLWLYLGGLAETLMCVSPIALGAVAYRASRRPHGSGGTRPRTTSFLGRCLPYFLVLLFAPVGFLLAFHLYAVLEMYFFLDPRHPSVLAWVVWHLSGAAVGAGVGALAALFVGSRLGRGSTPLVGLAVGGSVSMLVALALLNGLPLPPDSAEEYPLVIALLWCPWSAGLVVGVIVALPLRGYAEHARRWAARATAAVVLAGLVVVTLGMGWRFLRAHGIIVPELASALNAVCLMGIVAGALGTVGGAWKDRKGLAVDGAASRPAPASSSGRLRIGRGVGWLLLTFLWVVPLLVGLVLISLYEFSDHFRRTVIGPRDVGVIRVSGEYRVWLLNWAIRRQTVELPPVDRAEVMALADDRGSGDEEPFPLRRCCRERNYWSVHSRATVHDGEAEALAQIWRSRSLDGLICRGPHMYLLRFFSRGRLVLEAELIWQEESAHSAMVDDRFLLHAFIDENEELLNRLQEIAPLPDGAKAQIAYDHGLAAFDQGQYERALQELNRAVQLDPEHVQKRLSRAELYLAMGKRDKAIEEYTALVQRFPQNPVICRFRARAYIAAEDLPQAVDDYTRAFQYYEGNGHPHRGLQDLVARGLTYEKLGDLEQAVEDLSRAIELETEQGFGFPSGELLEARARMYEKLGDLPRALADLDAAFELDDQPMGEYGEFDEFGEMAFPGECPGPLPSEEDLATGPPGTPEIEPEASDEPALEGTGVPGWPALLRDRPLYPWSDDQFVDPWIAYRYVCRARIREALGDDEGARVDLYLVEQAGFDPDSDEWYLPSDLSSLLEPGTIIPEPGVPVPIDDSGLWP